jgi:glycerol-3-phosphate acyltransferase PlsY
MTAGEVGVAVAVLVGAYLMGTFPSASLVARRHGVDITTVGSGNQGTSNVIRNLGWRAGLVVFALDMAKGAASVALGGLATAAALGGESWAAGWGDAGGRRGWVAYACLVAAVMGHTFPVIRSTRGGKGVATAGGGVFVLYFTVSAVLCASWFVLGKATRKGSVASLTIAFLTPIGMWLSGAAPWEVGVLVALVAFVFWKHQANLGRLRAGTEPDLLPPDAPPSAPAPPSPPTR